MRTPWPPGPAGRLLVLTDSSQIPNGEPLLERLHTLVEAGVRAVVLRERHLPADVRAQLGAQVAEVLAAAGGLVLWASPRPADDPLAGWHDPASALTSAPADCLTATPTDCATATPTDCTTATPTDCAGWRGVSVHNADEMRLAVSSGYHYATVSPWGVSASKPGYGPALGSTGTSALVSCAATLPCYALGGVVPQACFAIQQAGAQGVAVMGELMRTSEPQRRVGEYLEAIEEAWGGP